MLLKLTTLGKYTLSETSTRDELSCICSHYNFSFQKGMTKIFFFILFNILPRLLFMFTFEISAEKYFV